MHDARVATISETTPQYMPYAAYCGSAHLALGLPSGWEWRDGVFPRANTIRNMANWTMQVLLSIDVAAQVI